MGKLLEEITSYMHTISKYPINLIILLKDERKIKTVKTKELLKRDSRCSVVTQYFKQLHKPCRFSEHRKWIFEASQPISLKKEHFNQDLKLISYIPHFCFLVALPSSHKTLKRKSFSSFRLSIICLNHEMI